MNKHTVFNLILLSFLFSNCNNGEPLDLTDNIVGTYDGIVSLYLDTDSTLDINNQTVEITKLDDNNIQILLKSYPAKSPAQGQSFNALLTKTPYGFIRTEGVMLTLESLTITEGVIHGTPYLVQGGDREAHGSYNREKGELVFALEVNRNGVVEYELFSGNKQ